MTKKVIFEERFEENEELNNFLGRELQAEGGARAKVLAQECSSTWVPGVEWVRGGESNGWCSGRGGKVTWSLAYHCKEPLEGFEHRSAMTWLWFWKAHSGSWVENSLRNETTINWSCWKMYNQGLMHLFMSIIPKKIAIKSYQLSSTCPLSYSGLSYYNNIFQFP